MRKIAKLAFSRKSKISEREVRLRKTLKQVYFRKPTRFTKIKELRKLAELANFRNSKDLDKKWNCGKGKNMQNSAKMKHKTEYCICGK